MAPWGSPDAYVKVKCEDDVVRTFTERGKSNFEDMTKGYVTERDLNGNQHKIPGFVRDGKFVANRLAKWASLVCPELRPKYPVDNRPMSERIKDLVDPSYKVDRNYGPPK